VARGVAKSRGHIRHGVFAGLAQGSPPLVTVRSARLYLVWCMQEEPGTCLLAKEVSVRCLTSPVSQGPQFNYFDLKRCKRGEIYRVELSSALNVLLVDSSGFSAFKAGGQHRHWGGLITRSPHDSVIPHGGHWYLVYHAWGLRSGGRISIRPLVEAQAMPPASPNIVSLESIAQAAAEYSSADHAPPLAPAAKEYDVFISHASEDKDAIVRDLASALDAEGLTSGTTNSN
jgi:Domain of unknown function (DUF1883)